MPLFNPLATLSSRLSAVLVHITHCEWAAENPNEKTGFNENVTW